MTKTGQQVEDDVFAMLQGSILAQAVSGSVYKYDLRPRNSSKEDVIVKFVTGLDGQIQTGVVVVNVYVHNVDAYQNGVMLRNVARCAKLEQVANEWVHSLTVAKSNYRFSLMQTIYTEADEDIKQHFVSIRLKFKLPNF